MYFFVCDPNYRPKILIPDLGAVIPDLIYFITTLVNQKPLYLCEAYGYFLGAHNSYDDDE